MNLNKIVLLSGLVVNSISFISFSLSASATNLFVSNDNNTILEIKSGTNTAIPFVSSGLSLPTGLAFAPVPEPLNILGATTGLALFGTVSTALKRRKLTK